MRLWSWIPVGRVPEVAPQELWAWLEAGEVQVVDVRSASEFRRSHIRGARHLAITAFSAGAVQELQLDPVRRVVSICLTAHRSIPATRQLRQLGYEASQLAGGMLAWWRAELPCVTGDDADAGGDAGRDGAPVDGS